MTAPGGNVVPFPMPFIDPVISAEEQAFLDKLEEIERRPGPLLESTDSIMQRAVAEARNRWPEQFIENGKASR